MGDGSYGGGFLLGFLLGLIGLVIAIAMDKSETKRGAIHGFIAALGLAIVIFVIALAAGAFAISSIY